MKKIAILLTLVILVLCLLLSGCSRKKEAKESDDPSTPAANLSDGLLSDDVLAELPDTLPDSLPEPSENIILVGQVMKDAVNVRQAASTTSTALGKVSRGDLLLVLKSGTLAGDNGGSWYEVRYNGKSAYIHADFLTTQEMTEDAIITVGTVVNVDSVLNIRAEPDSQSQRVGRANKGDKFVVLAQNVGDGSWTKIEYADGVAGVAYVKSEFINVVQQMIVNMLLL